jgi:hypothetical protein
MQYFSHNRRTAGTSTGTTVRAEATHLGSQPFELQPHARLAAECAQRQTRSASRATCPVSAACAAPHRAPLTFFAAMRYVPARPSAVRQQRPIARRATRIVLRLPRHTPKNAVWERRAAAVHAWRSWRAARRSARAHAAARCRRPHLRHRGVELGKLVTVACFCVIARRLPAPIEPMLCGCLPLGCGRHSVPVVVRDGLVGPADEQRNGAVSGETIASSRRMVQRCVPAGHSGHGASATGGRSRQRPDGRGKAHPSSPLMFTSARASMSLWTVS